MTAEMTAEIKWRLVVLELYMLLLTGNILLLNLFERKLIEGRGTIIALRANEGGL
jgi:hypothetical protein